MSDNNSIQPSVPASDQDQIDRLAEAIRNIKDPIVEPASFLEHNSGVVGAALEWTKFSGSLSAEALEKMLKIPGLSAAYDTVSAGAEATGELIVGNAAEAQDGALEAGLKAAGLEVGVAVKDFKEAVQDISVGDWKGALDNTWDALGGVVGSAAELGSGTIKAVGEVIEPIFGVADKAVAINKLANETVDAIKEDSSRATLLDHVEALRQQHLDLLTAKYWKAVEEVRRAGIEPTISEWVKPITRPETAVVQDTDNSLADQNDMVQQLNSDVAVEPLHQPNDPSIRLNLQMNTTATESDLDGTNRDEEDISPTEPSVAPLGSEDQLRKDIDVEDYIQAVLNENEQNETGFTQDGLTSLDEDLQEFLEFEEISPADLGDVMSNTLPFDRHSTSEIYGNPAINGIEEWHSNGNNWDVSATNYSIENNLPSSFNHLTSSVGNGFASSGIDINSNTQSYFADGNYSVPSNTSLPDLPITNNLLSGHGDYQTSQILSGSGNYGVTPSSGSSTESFSLSSITGKTSADYSLSTIAHSGTTSSSSSSTVSSSAGDSGGDSSGGEGTAV